MRHQFFGTERDKHTWVKTIYPSLLRSGVYLKLNITRKKALFAIFLFQHSFHFNPYISHRPRNSLKHFTVEVSPVWTYILPGSVAQSHWNYQVLGTFLKPWEYQHQINRSTHYSQTDYIDHIKLELKCRKIQKQRKDCLTSATRFSCAIGCDKIEGRKYQVLVWQCLFYFTHNVQQLKLRQFLLNYE